jgi:hypothetical protein
MLEIKTTKMEAQQLSLKKLPLRQGAEWILRAVLNMVLIKIPTASGKK